MSGRPEDSCEASSAAAIEREVVETRSLSGVQRENLFERLLDVERFPEWGYGLRRVRLRQPSSTLRGLRPGDGIEFGLRAAGLEHRVTSVVTLVQPPRLIEWRYTSGAAGYGGWLLEAGQENGETVRMTLSTDYSVEPPWLNSLAHKPFFRGIISDLLSRSLRRLEADIKREIRGAV